ncbi:hypothetical protein C8C85_1721 [Flavobacterium sp. 103]|uniref:hypothetical protein n=1 Tax=Flavobacterium sp. 103 TaxID=2135624 RepID=UPI000D5E94A7|nr:hypothetical protein [Flavobacterium sp. 103]PVX45912.1 hypothetical protein C8C85_1721 [Flavobacterium sp. 103]
MKLTAQQIDQLYAFTRRHYVEWYDLQSELVDHLANAIEHESEQNPNRNFEEILNKEFQKFGVFGFMHVVEERQKFLNKKYTRLIWSYYKEFFGLPKIILTVALVFGVHTINQLIASTDFFPTVVVFFLLVSGFFTFKKRYYFKKKAKETRLKWLFEDIMLNRVSLMLFLLPSMIINFFNPFRDNFVPSGWSVILAEIAFVLVGLLVFIQLIIIPKRVASDLEKTYPEYSLHKA